MSYDPCRFKPFDLPDYEPLPPGYMLSLPRRARVPNPLAFERGTAQFAPATTSWPINVPKVKPNPPTHLSFASIQDPWHQFGLRWQAPCNVWSRNEVKPRPNGNMYGAAEQPSGADKKTSELRYAILAITALALGTIAIAGMAPKV